MKVFLGILSTFLVLSGSFATDVYLFKNQEAVNNLEGPFESLANTTINAVIASYKDPYDAGSSTISGTDSALNGSVTISNITLAGIHGLGASFIKIDALSLALNMTVQIPDLVVSGKFNSEYLTLAELLPFWGDGSFSLTITGSQIQVYGRADLFAGFAIKNATIAYHIGDLAFDLQGVLNNDVLSQLLSKALTDNVAVFLNNNEKLLASIINGALNGESTVEEAVSNVLTLAVKAIPQSTQRLVKSMVLRHRLANKN